LQPIHHKSDRLLGSRIGGSDEIAVKALYSGLSILKGVFDMWLKSKLRFAVAILASGLIMDMALAAQYNCAIVPENAVIVAGQTVTLTATCDTTSSQPLTSVNWAMDGTSVTGDVPVTQVTAGNPVLYTTPVGAGSGTYLFTMTGLDSATTPNDYVSGTTTVVVKPANVVAKVQTGQVNTVNGVCGNANGASTQAMPSTSNQCSSGNVALAITTPSGFSWSCLSPNSGQDASCYAVRGYTVTASVNGSGGTVSPLSQPVASGGTATVSAAPDSTYATTFSSNCGGSQSGNNYTTGAVTSTCTVTATFSQNMNGVCGSQKDQMTTSALSSTSPNLCSSGAVTQFSANTSGAQWTCQGSGTGSSPSCSAPMGYAVTASGSDANGNSVNSAFQSQTIQAGQVATINVTLATGYTANVDANSTCPSGTWSSATTYRTGAISAPCNVTLNYAKQSAGISCNGKTMPGTVVEVVTKEMAAGLPRLAYTPKNGDEVYAFQITTPATGQFVKNLSSTKLTDSMGGKRVVISSCRGDYDPTGKVPGCARLATEATTVTAVVGYPANQVNSNYYCLLQPGQTYWVNVSARANKDQATANCTKSTQCKFYFEGN